VAVLPCCFATQSKACGTASAVGRTVRDVKEFSRTLQLIMHETVPTIADARARCPALASSVWQKCLAESLSVSFSLSSGDGLYLVYCAGSFYHNACLRCPCNLSWTVLFVWPCTVALPGLIVRVSAAVSLLHAHSCEVSP
jgi:hypothetical protein